MKFQKGQSGNPGGRPKVVAEVKALAQEHTGAAIKALADIVVNKKAPHSARVAAAQALLDRGHGRPMQYVDATVRKGPLDNLTADELSDLVNALARGETGDQAGSGEASEPSPSGNLSSVH